MLTVRTLKVLACADEGVNTAPRGGLSGVGSPLKRVEQPRSGQVHPRQPGGRVAGLPRCGVMRRQRPLCRRVASPSSRKRASCAAAIASLLSVASLVASPSAGMHTKLGWSCMEASAWSQMYLPLSAPASYLSQGENEGEGP